MATRSQFSLVLGGGGLKGLAHVGVLRALEERDLVPEVVVGCSIGALIGAAWATGMPPCPSGERNPAAPARRRG